MDKYISFILKILFIFIFIPSLSVACSLENNRVRDELGRELSVEKPFQRIISLKMVSDFKKTVNAFTRLSAGIEKKKRVYFEAMHSRMKTFTNDSMAVFVLETAGGFNIAADAKRVRNTNIAVYNKEKILSKAGEIDVFLAQKGAMNNPDRETILNEPGFKVIKAVREGQIFFIDEMIVSRPSFRLLIGIYEIGSLLYPDIFVKEGKKILDETSGLPCMVKVG